MKEISLEDFRDQIDDVIVDRGLAYFKKGHVEFVDEMSPGKFVGMIRGTEKYRVELNIEDGLVTNHYCPCPYDMGPVCKHIVAALFFIQQDKLKIKVNKIPDKRSKDRADVKEILKKVSAEELRRFVIEKSESNESFERMFRAEFSHLLKDMSIKEYTKQIKEILSQSSGRKKFIGYHEAPRAGMYLNHILEAAEKNLNANDLRTASVIARALINELIPALQYTDDSDGVFGSIIENSISVLGSIPENNPDDDLRKEIIKYCFDKHLSGKFKGWDWHIDMLEIAFKYISEKTEYNQLCRLLDEFNSSDFDSERARHLKLKALKKFGTKKEVQDFINRNLSNPLVREEAIMSAILEKNYAEAKKICEDGIEHDKKDWPGLAKKWYDNLLEIAMFESDKIKTIEYARMLFINNFLRERDYYKILKDNIEPEKWNEFLEDMISEISNTRSSLGSRQIEDIYIKEQMFDRLLALVSKNPNLYTLSSNEKYLAKNYSPELIQLYYQAIIKYLTENVSRTHYQTACRYIRRMRKLGGRDKADQIIAELKAKYPNRTALIDELDRL